MDPLSVSTGVAGFISLGLEVTKLLVQFYKDYAGQAADLSHTTRRLSVLSATLGGLKSHLDNRKFHDGEQELVTVVEEAVCICNDYIDELRHHLAKFEQHKTGTIWSKMGASTSTRQLAYPFRKSTLEKLDRDISEASSSAAFALQVLQEGIMARTYDQIEQVSERLGVVYGMTKESTINDWLQAPDSSATYNVACAKKEPGTGLCQRIGIAFYFFSFAHGGEQTVSEMLRSLVLQLSNQCDFTLLEKLHDRYKNKTPPNEARLSCLQRLLQSFENVCVFLDALDECVRDNFGPCDQWDELLETINLIRGWSIPGLHMLTTSRDDPEIRDTLGPSTDERISMKNPAVNSDIARFIDAQLKSAMRGHTSTVKTLVDLGADVNTTAGFFGTALKQAAQAGHVATVSELLIGGADVDAGGALHEAAAKGHTGIVQLLIDHGVALNAKNGIRAFTALQYSVKHGHTATATLLIERGADINVSHCFEGTAVDIAARGGHEGLVRLLISSGVDIERWSKCEQETTGDLRSRLAKQSDRFSTFETVD
ncbi:reverse transcriptase [Purpureocillium lavendulum]|uniref:Reverse transcriptase n=1 Tax=Purpureocillium lavendulum TaxID=1247861 RepID=A0AB34FE77_9HYPO|nr:reverse transcriptase [Purpureocillium lavendulum]